MTTLVATLGLSPLRLAGTVAAERPDRLVCVCSGGTAYRADVLARLLGEVALPVPVSVVVVDEFEPDLTALAAQLTDSVSGAPEVAVDLTGGTKAMIVAVLDWWLGLPATRRGHRRHVDVDRDRIVAQDGTWTTAHLPTPPLQTVAQLHDGLSATWRVPKWRGAAVTDLLRNLERGPAAHTGEPGRRFEDAVSAAVARVCRGLVVGSVNVVLRSHMDPDAPVLDAGGRPRMFELDTVRLRGGRVWVLESKHRRLREGEALDALAEVVRRARQFGGPDAAAALLFLDDAVAERVVEVSSLLEGPLPAVFGRSDAVALLSTAVQQGPIDDTLIGKWFTT